MKGHFQYLIDCLRLIFIQSLLVILVCISLDPYGVLNISKIQPFNSSKPAQINNTRLFKAIQITHQKPTAIFLGSSRTDLGLSTNHPILNPFSMTYNLGLLGANIYETRRYFEHAIANQPHLKKAIIGLDFFMFNQNRSIRPDFDQNRLNKQQIIFSDFSKITFSLQALFASGETWKASQKHPYLTPYRETGEQNEDYFLQEILWDGSIIKQFSFSLRRFFKDPELYGNYQLSEAAIQEVTQMVNLCQSHQIECFFFISPAHAMQWEAIYRAGLWPIFEEWKGKISQITPVWDFSGYNRITTEPFSDQMQYYLDNSHYRKNVGALVLNRLFNYSISTIPPDFGVFLTPENLASHLEQMRRDRATWQKSHPNEVKFVEKQFSS